MKETKVNPIEVSPSRKSSFQLALQEPECVSNSSLGPLLLSVILFDFHWCGFLFIYLFLIEIILNSVVQFLQMSLAGFLRKHINCENFDLAILPVNLEGKGGGGTPLLP